MEWTERRNKQAKSETQAFFFKKIPKNHYNNIWYLPVGLKTAPPAVCPTNQLPLNIFFTFWEQIPSSLRTNYYRKLRHTDNWVGEGNIHTGTIIREKEG